MILQNVMNLLHISAYWQYVWTGLLTLLAVAIYSIVENKMKLVY